MPDPVHVLIVEDSITQATRLAYVLEGLGYRCATASSGRAGLEAMRARLPALVISDVVMPEMDGYEFCRRVRSDESLKDTPVILLTSLSETTDILRGLECGADNFITKPYEVEYLLARVEYILANRRLRRVDRLQVGVELEFGGRRHFITAERQQILDLLISTYEQAVQLNNRLRAREEELEAINSRLAALNAVGNTVSQSLELDKILGDSLDRVLEALDLEGAAIFLLQDDHLVSRAERHFPQALKEVQVRRDLLEWILTWRQEVPGRPLDGTEAPTWIWAALGFESCLWIPLASKGHVNGAMVIGSYFARDFSPADRDLLQGIGNQIAVAIENARLFELTQARRIQEQEALFRLSQLLLATLDMREIQMCAIDVTLEILPADFCSVALPDATGENLVVVACDGQEADSFLGLMLPLDSNTAGAVAYRTQSPVRVGPGESSPEEAGLHPAAIQAGFRSAAAVPMVVHQQALGVLFVTRRDAVEYTHEEMRLLALIGNQCAAALSNARLYREAQSRAELLAESEAKYRLLFNNLPDALWVHDEASLRFLAVNDTTVSRYGYDHEQLLALSVPDLWPEAQKAPELVSDPGRFNGVWQHRRRDGSIVWVDQTSHPIEFSGQAARLVVATDITQRRLLEEQLLHSQKMESIGTLAGGVAHDFNNLLTGIMGLSDLALMELGPDHPVRPDLEEIRELGSRAAILTRQLLTFARKQVLERKTVSLNAIVLDLANLLRRVIGETIELEVRTDATLPLVAADVSQMEQVLMNLCVNARDAMGQGGRLVVETRFVALEEEYCAVHPWARPGIYCVLAVTDTGCGMDRATLERIFEPFFTTKEAGRGTGLGLAMVYGIVQQHEGFIHVYSEPGRGTTFKIFMPAVGGQVETRSRAAPEAPKGGTETILVAEDEEAVRKLILAALESRGYTVLAAADGEAALRLFEEHPSKIDLVLSDTVMPRMGGHQLYDAVRLRRPDVRFVLMSGYSAQHGSVPDRGDGNHPDHLEKPFGLLDLVRKVRQVLTS